MELRELWKKLDSDKLTKPVLGAVRIQKKIQTSGTNVKECIFDHNGIFFVFLIGFMVLFFLFDETIVKAGLVFMIANYIFFFVANFSMYRKVNVVLPIDQSLKKALEHTYQFITENIHFQERMALFIYPLAAASGF